jgi:hypothetical protein
MESSEDRADPGVVRGPRHWLPLVLILWAALLGWLTVGWPWDAVQLQIAARAYLAGSDPYAAVPTAGFPFELYYPFTAVLLAVPFAAMPDALARVVWAAGTGAAFAWGVRGAPRVAALSAGFAVCLVLGQIAPAMMGVAALPWLGFLLAAKPSIGLALFAAYPSRRTLISGAAFVALSLVLLPDWPLRWLHALGTMPQHAPVVMPGGAILLLGFLRWRTPEGRLIGTLSLVPHGAYDAVVLFLACRTLRQGLALAALSWAGAFASGWLWPHTPEGGMPHPGRWLVALVSLYLPALWLVLRRPADAPSSVPPSPSQL